MSEKMHNPENLNQPVYLSGDVIDYSSIVPEKGLVLVIEDTPNGLGISSLKITQDGKYRASGIGGGHERPADRQAVLVDHLGRDEMLDALARWVGEEGSDEFNLYRDTIAPGVDEILSKQ